MSRWRVSIAVTKRGRVRGIVLGEVEAADYAAALHSAWDRWPEKMDPRVPQCGFSLRLIEARDKGVGE